MDERTLVIHVSSADELKARMLAAFETGVPDVAARYSFPSQEQLLRTLTPGRWRLIEVLTGAEPLGVRELARRAGRDVKGVHTDAQALALCGLIERTDDAKYSVPYDRVEVQFGVTTRTAA